MEFAAGSGLALPGGGSGAETGNACAGRSVNLNERSHLRTTMRFTRSAARSSTCAIALALSVMLLNSPGPARAVAALRPTLGERAKALHDLLKGRGEDAIFVGSFTGVVGKSRTPAGAGPGIKNILVEELKNRGVRIDDDAKLEIGGDYRDVVDP